LSGGADVAKQLVEIRVPDIGNYTDVEVIEVAVQPGDAVALEGTLITLETEKATVDIPSTTAGVVREMKLQRGSRVSQGDVIAIVEADAANGSAGGAEEAADEQEAAAEKPAAKKAAAKPAAEEAAGKPAAGEVAAQPASAKASAQSATKDSAQSAPQPTSAEPSGTVVASPGSPAIDEPGFARAHASPSIRRLARELGVDLARVQGTGAKGRITDTDVKGYVKQVLTGGGGRAAPEGAGLPQVPAVDFAAFGPIERQPLTRIQKIAGPRLHASWVNLPHVTQFDEADITAMEAARADMKQEAAERGIKLTPLAFIMRACVQALREFPQFGASLDQEAGELVLKKYMHVGFAADTPQGLVVPVVRDADRKDVFELATELATLSEKARNGKLSGPEMQGGCFTISSLGGIGGTAFTPIINAPEVAILGVSRSAHKPVYQDGEFVPRLMLPLSLSYDHRVIDGASAARFTTFLAAALADVPGLTRAIP
jgi:pyruvate dehydrogenase E2 component (dihydrolipoamide acetyltransferase)